ncbi:hypothetical protein M422DRAFT_273446 [Sphaerobolus stellatus SS14]|uniref:Uncharacterized protein n=1 Tax=Sphaerobolus stellatus (strain SS14) TaxID=990650 RepID=A0A0C9UJZ5_SPHS4|nr:hypothetical protein M422DRAFT_273446 [Sphaerobolus stellatus SS14]
MAHKKKTDDKIPAGTSDAVDSGSSTTTRANNPLAKTTNELELSENIPQTPNPPGGDRDPPPAEKSSELPEPSGQSASADPDPKELVLGNQLQEILDTINKHMDEVESSSSIIGENQ